MFGAFVVSACLFFGGCGFSFGSNLSSDYSADGFGSERENSSSQSSEIIVPAGYTAEIGENMFWEKEDVIVNGYVKQNPDIHIYNYAPSIMQTDENTCYAYYCSNRYSTDELKDFTYSGVSAAQQGDYKDFPDELGDNRITDYIVCRKGVKSENVWYWSEKNYVLGPTIGSRTEGEQTCDPNVIGGNFRYDGKVYKYLMAYLACATRDNNYNHVCLAVADDPMGPWKKCEKINPLICYDGPAAEYCGGDEDLVPDDMKVTAGSEIHWGYGQPSMINTDKKGKVLMFYSTIKPFKGDNGWFRGTYTSVARYDFSDLNDIKFDFMPVHMDVNGINEYHGDKFEQAYTTVNGDYAYDPLKGRIYGIFENYGGKGLYYAANKSKSDIAEIGDVFRDYVMYSWGSNGLKWRKCADIEPVESIYYQGSHNNCIVRDEYGWLLDGKNMEAAVTGTCPSDTINTEFPGREALYTFRILRKKISLS